MNKVIILAGSLLLSVSLYAQVNYHITGKVPTGYPASIATIGYPNDGKYMIDSAIIKSGRFEFKGVMARPELAEINLIIPRPAGARSNRSGEDKSPSMKNIIQLYMDGNIAVAFDSDGNGSVTGGGNEQKVFNEYMIRIIEEGKNDNNKGMDFFRQNVSQLIKQHPDSYVSLDMLEIFAGVIQPATFEPMYTGLSKRMRNTPKAISWKKRLDEAKKFDVGQPSVDFTANDQGGKPVSLSSYKGRYVLVDFWASWCGPCRASFPELINTYNQFKGKNFAILGVSLDDNKELWLKAIETDSLPWDQVSELKGASSDVAQLYNVTQIPQNLLIDPNGIIVGRNLTGKSLDEKLAKLLN